jgi:NDP-sugar pyrophosphorylase family protein
VKAIVLAAGKGSRLSAYTHDIPKPMLPVGGRPVLEHLLRKLKGMGVDQIFINLHHQPDIIRSYFGTGEKLELSIQYAFEPELLGTAGALRNFAGEFDNEPSFYVCYGDNLFDCDFAPLRGFHEKTGALATVGLFVKDDVRGSGVADLDQEGRVTRFVEKPDPASVTSCLVNAGVYVVSPEIMDFIHRVPCDFGHDVFPAMLAGDAALYGMVLDGTVRAIDTPELYEKHR